MSFWQRFASVLLVVGLVIFSQPIINGAQHIGDFLTGAVDYAQGLAQQSPSDDRGVDIQIGDQRGQEESFSFDLRFDSEDSTVVFKADEDNAALQMSGKMWDRARGRIVDVLNDLGLNLSISN